MVGEDIMKLVITVTDDQAATEVQPAEHATADTAAAVFDGQAAQTPALEVYDGGPVPHELVEMEAQVAAGLLPAPGTTSPS